MGEVILDQETLAPICHCCDLPGEPEHDCPYSQEFGGADTCTCCAHCHYQCADDI